MEENTSSEGLSWFVKEKGQVTMACHGPARREELTGLFLV
jgi:hypothetical protein